MSDADLVIRARAGDATAWEQLVRQHQTAVFRLAYLHVGNANDAEDVAQETFIRAFRNLRSFDATRPLKPWLLQITANTARNQRRSLGRYVAAVQRFLQTAPAAPVHHDAYNLEQEAETLWQAIRRLKPPAQQVLYLRYFLDLSEKEVAEALDVPRGTVKSRLHRSLRRLQQVIENDFPGLRQERLP